jgi:hypothetical protein
MAFCIWIEAYSWLFHFFKIIFLKMIADQKTPLGKAKKLSRQGSSNNFLEPELQYIDLRPRMQKILVFSLRNETDPMKYSL